jgi:muramoyltetrapeptide carboxypeptidase
MMHAFPRLRPGDRVRIVSPSSPPDRDGVMRGSELLSHWGLIPEIAPHAFDRHGHYLAGRDEDRLADLNDALRDPGVRAIFTTRGGKGAYRIADRIDFDAAARDPKPLVGFSDTTILHLALWHRARVGAVHGPHVEWHGPLGSQAAERLRRVLMESAPIVVRRDSHEITAAVTSAGTATGPLMGGNLSLIARAVGWTCPSFAGSILVIEDVDKHIGHIDSALTQLLRSGVLDGLRGVAIGQFIRCAEPKPGKWSIVDVLRDRLLPLGVPILGGLPIGHGPDPYTIALGATATIDVAAGALTIQTSVA